MSTSSLNSELLRLLLTLLILQIILHERMQNLGLRSSHVNWEFCAHGLFTAYGNAKYERLDRAVQDMLQVIIKAVDDC